MQQSTQLIIEFFLTRVKMSPRSHARGKLRAISLLLYSPRVRGHIVTHFNTSRSLFCMSYLIDARTNIIVTKLRPTTLNQAKTIRQTDHVSLFERDQTIMYIYLGHKRSK